MSPIDAKTAERVAALIRRGDDADVCRVLTSHPECLAFLDVPEPIVGSSADSWSDYAKQLDQEKLASMLFFDFPDPVLRAIYGAIDAGDIERLRQLLADHPRYFHGRPGQIERMLIGSAREGQITVVEMLLEMGADLNAISIGSTALSRAVGNAPPEMVAYLLSRGADPNDVTRPIIGAINREPEQVALRLVQLLVEHGADVNCEYTVFGDKENTFTPLEWAKGKALIADYLRSKGAVEREKKAPEKATPKNLAEEIVAYFDEHFGAPQRQAQIEMVPTNTPISIHVIPAAENRKHVTVFTTGMSEQPMQAPEGTDDFRFAELFIQLAGSWPIDKESLSDPKHAWPINWLRSIAKYPHQHNTWLGGPVTIIANGDPPEPLAPGLRFTSVLVMADQQFTSRDGRTIYLYRLMPLYTEERSLEIKEGIGALMRAFDNFDVPPVVDLARPNVATEKH